MRLLWIMSSMCKKSSLYQFMVLIFDGYTCSTLSTKSMPLRVPVIIVNNVQFENLQLCLRILFPFVNHAHPGMAAGHNRSITFVIQYDTFNIFPIIRAFMPNSSEDLHTFLGLLCVHLCPCSGILYEFLGTVPVVQIHTSAFTWQWISKANRS
jgi:hypothetical protein